MQKRDYNLTLAVKYISGIRRIQRATWVGELNLHALKPGCCNGECRDGADYRQYVTGRTAKNVVDKLSKEIYAAMLHQTDFKKWLVSYREL